MKIDYKSETEYTFYETEIKRALDWLYKIRDNEKNGWAWVQFIHPNEQNTAEVIYTYTENTEWLENNPDKIDRLAESIDYWLLDVSHATLSIDYCWVLLALQKIRSCKYFNGKISQEKLEKAISECLAWLESNYLEDTEKGIGWCDNNSEISNVIRTSLATIALNREIEYLTSENLPSDKIKSYEHMTEKTCKWMKSIQNGDGGWGNLDASLITQEYQRTHNFSYRDLVYQCDSNAASTGYAMLALCSGNKNNYESELKKAFEYLKNTQTDNGGWGVFTEIGVRNGERYTFRHFGTAWALQGILSSGCGNYKDECIIHGFEYLSCLQDENYGGWKSSPDADNYTWATCNALVTINMLKRDLAEVHAKHFLGVVWDWWSLKKKDANFSFKLKNTVFAFNSNMALIFCIVFSAMITLLLAMTINVTEPLLFEKSEVLRKFVYSVITVLDSVILGLPWIVYVKNIFKKDDEGWIDSIGWVYGIITGFVLVLYQFII